MTAVATCPQCQLQLSVPDEANTDSLVKCPVCRSTFELRSVRLAPMLTMIVVPDPPQAMASPHDTSVDELISPLPLPPEREVAPKPVEDELVLQDEPADEKILSSGVEPSEGVLDLNESLSAIEHSDVRDDANALPQYADDEEYVAPDESQEDNTPLENPEPTEIDEDSQDDLDSPQTALSSAVEQDEHLTSLTEELRTWTEDQEFDSTSTISDDEAEPTPASVESWSEPTDSQGSFGQDSLPESESQTESLELDEDQLEVPFASRETVQDVPLSGALPADVQPLFSSPPEPEPPRIGEPDALAEPHTDREVLATERDRWQPDDASNETGEVAEPTAAPPDVSSDQNASWETASSPETDEQQPAEYDAAPPIDLGSWQPGPPNQNTDSTDTVTAPPSGEVNPTSMVIDSGDDRAESPSWQITELMSSSESDYAEAPADLPPTDASGADATTAPDSIEDELPQAALDQEVLPDFSSSHDDSLPSPHTESEGELAEEPASSEPDRQRNAPIPLPGFDRHGETAEQSWFRSWMVLAALLVLASAGAAGFGIWSILSSGRSAPLLADTEGVDVDEAQRAVINQMAADPPAENAELASYDVVTEVPSAGDANVADPIPTPTEPGAFRESGAQPLSPTAHLVSAPMYSIDDVVQAFEVAQQAEPGLIAGDMSTDYEAKADSYVYFCDLAEKLTFLADNGGSYMMKLEAKDIFRRVLVEPKVRREVAQLAQMWMNSPTRAESGLNGIVVVGTLADVRYRGGAYEYFVDGGVAEPFRFVVPERLEPELFREGEAVVAAGSIIDQPEEAIAGYQNGDAQRTIWAGVVKLLDRPNDAPKDRRLSIFQDP